MAETPVEDPALAQIAAAKTPGALREAHRKVTTSVVHARRKAAAKLGKLAQAYTEAMELLDAQKAAGVPFAERIKGLEQVLRAVWPTTRDWKVLCLQCDDYGLVISECPGDATCGRDKAHLPHAFGKPCWCDKGRQFRDKPAPTGEDFAQAGKSKPRGGFTKAGR